MSGRGWDNFMSAGASCITPIGIAGITIRTIGSYLRRRRSRRRTTKSIITTTIHEDLHSKQVHQLNSCALPSVRTALRLTAGGQAAQ